MGRRRRVRTASREALTTKRAIYNMEFPAIRNPAITPTGNDDGDQRRGESGGPSRRALPGPITMAVYRMQERIRQVGWSG